MKIPYWLLKFLPMWDYVCPKCRREVPKNSHKCHHCGEHYPFPLKVPPQCLKSKEALEKYVHEKIFPKISSWQREYLAQYFTVIFSDGFESGDLTAWDGTEAYPASVAPVIVTSPVHHGLYACKFPANMGWSTLYKTLPTTFSTLFFRTYVMFGALPASGYDSIIMSVRTSAGEDIAWVGIYNNNGQMQWIIRNLGGGGPYYNVNDNIIANKWYCIELKTVISSSAGELRLYRDGTEILTRTNISTGTTNIGRIYVHGESGNVDVYHDCVVVADTGPIGQEPPPVYQQLIISATVGGTTSPAPGTYTVGQGYTVQVTAIPDSGYRFDHWELDGNNIGAANPITVLMDTDHTLLAVFVAVPTHTLTVDSTPIQGVPFTIERVS